MWQEGVKVARVRDTREEDMIIGVSSDGAKVTRTDKRFVCVIEMCFLDEEEVGA